MKKILMMLFVVGFSFSLAACEEETKVTCSDSEELVNGVCEEVNVCNDGYELIDDECSMIITENHVLIPSFFGMEYGDVLNWSFDNDVTLVPSSEFNDDVEPNTVFYQDIKGGEYILKGSEVAVRYSRGYDPNGEISLIDFTGMNQDEIKVWLKSNNIGNYAFNRTYDEAVAGGDFVKVVVKKIDERDENLRRDQYVFSYSAGNLVVEELDFSNPDSIRGVNLGGWFVLEGWMTPGLFSGVDGSDETAYGSKNRC